MKLSNRIHIGIDFDNTIVIYDDVFFKYAFDMGLISKDVKKKKQIIRDTIRKLPNGEAKWIELQAIVYGRYINEAKPAKGIKEFVQTCIEKSVSVSIISHKTEYPALGPQLNLRDAAITWLDAHGFFSEFELSRTDAMFVETRDQKFCKIIERQCTHFIDDLIEVLTHDKFPKHVEGILYEPDLHENVPRYINHFGDWSEIRKYFFGF